MHTEVLGDHVLISIWTSSCKSIIYLISWKTGTVTFVSGSSKFCLVLNSHESLKLRGLPERSTCDNRGPLAVAIGSSMVSLIDICGNRLEICELELDPDPRLKTLCFLELPPLVSGTSHFFFGDYSEWVPTSKTYARTRSSRGYHLPFYSSAIGTIALHLYHHPQFDFETTDLYTLIISITALVSIIPTDAHNIPWEVWGPSSTHLFKMPTTTTHLTPAGPFWIMDPRSVVRQYDLRHAQYTQLMAGDKSLVQSRPSIVDSTKLFQYDIETHLPYRDVVMEKQDLNKFAYILADREWLSVYLPWYVCFLSP